MATKPIYAEGNGGRMVDPDAKKALEGYVIKFTAEADVVLTQEDDETGYKVTKAPAGHATIKVDAKYPDPYKFADANTDKYTLVVHRDGSFERYNLCEN